MYELKKMERYLRVNLLGPGPCRMKKEFTGPRSHKGWETLTYRTQTNRLLVTAKTLFLGQFDPEDGRKLLSDLSNVTNWYGFIF